MKKLGDGIGAIQIASPAVRSTRQARISWGDGLLPLGAMRLCACSP